MTKYGVGIDCGTMNLVVARVGSNDKISFKRSRNLFLSLPKDQKKSLGRLKALDLIEREDDILILGDQALSIANALNKEVRRPLQGGLIASGEIAAMEVLATMIKDLLGPPRTAEECCFYSVPAAPVDDRTKDVIYHTDILGKIIRECGYEPVASNEAKAIVFADCESSDFTGIACSFGSGMTNVALVYKTLPLLEFSIGMGGDYIDAKAAAQFEDMTPSAMCSIKESGVNLLSPEGREQETLVVYYDHLIKTVIHHIVAEFNKVKNKFRITESIPVVISGGTSMAKGFLDLFKRDLEAAKFPVKISEIRLSSHPLQAVAQGLLVQAAQEHDD